jgi:hypothetical protein
VSPPTRDDSSNASPDDPQAVLSRFFNAIFGHTRNWPRAYDCLSPAAHERFDSAERLRSFADYWEDRLSFLEELVKNRHGEFPYTHRSCFTPDHIQCRELSADRAVFAIQLIENHVASERLTIDQVKALEKRGGRWLMTNGELEGDLDSIISVMRRRKKADEAAI